MAEDDRSDGRSAGDLKRARIRICPACGVVNPSGPGESCPHLQLARFDGLDDALAALLGEAAEARKRYADLAAALKRAVKEAVRSGRAEVEATRKSRFSDVEVAAVRPPAAGPLQLESPAPPPPKEQRPRRRRGTQVPAVDSRQLELISRMPPKGDA